MKMGCSVEKLRVREHSHLGCGASGHLARCRAESDRVAACAPAHLLFKTNKLVLVF
jgi:hypothetical protein